MSTVTVGETVKVVYIAGASRSGSTLLDMLLGQLPSHFAAGELKYFGGRNLRRNRPCGCGRAFYDCPVWKAIMKTGNLSSEDSSHFERLDKRLRLRSVWWPSHSAFQRGAGEDGPTAAKLADLYGAIKHATGCDYVIDSSKVPAYGYFLGTLPTIDLYVVHLVRDARAVAYSWTRAKPLPGLEGRSMPTMSPFEAAFRWNTENAMTEALWGQSPQKYRRVRYEDLVADPSAALRGVLEMIGDRTHDFPFVGEDSVRLRTVHTASGNPDRFRRGSIPLRLDDEWRSLMPKRHRLLVSALTKPLLNRYGYS